MNVFLEAATRSYYLYIPVLHESCSYSHQPKGACRKPSSATVTPTLYKVLLLGCSTFDLFFAVRNRTLSGGP